MGLKYYIKLLNQMEWMNCLIFQILFEQEKLTDQFIVF